MVSAMDESIGDITNTLKVTKLFDDAIVVFFSDVSEVLFITR